MEVSAVNTLLDLLHLREVYLFTLAFRWNPVLPAILQAAIEVEVRGEKGFFQSCYAK